MKNIIKISLLLLVTVALSSCYNKYVHDYDYTSTGFAIQNPLRTIVADRGMDMYVGVYIGGKRDVDMNDWAKFRIDESLLEGKSFTLLPEEYYTLTSPDKFTVRKSNLPVADVGISFTDEFFNDPAAINNTYALPFIITEHSQESIPEGKEHSIVVIKYVSAFSGTYYVRGSVSELNNDGTVKETREYYNMDISQNLTRNLVTLSRYELRRMGLADLPANATNRVGLKVEYDDSEDLTYNVIVGKADGNNAIDIFDGNGTYYGSTDIKTKRPKLELKYKYKLDGVTYSVEEEMFLQKDPVDALRVETW